MENEMESLDRALRRQQALKPYKKFKEAKTEYVGLGGSPSSIKSPYSRQFEKFLDFRCVK